MAHADVAGNVHNSERAQSLFEHDEKLAPAVVRCHVEDESTRVAGSGKCLARLSEQPMRRKTTAPAIARTAGTGDFRDL